MYVNKQIKEGMSLCLRADIIGARLSKQVSVSIILLLYDYKVEPVFDTYV